MTADLLILFGIHYLSDFLLQPREMGKKKSEDIQVMLHHMAWIFVSMIFLGQFALDGQPLIEFTFAYTILHGLQDWFIWRDYKWRVRREIARENFNDDRKNTWMEEELKIFKYWEDSKFYDTIGLDQTLHFITIVALYNWVIK